jgi:FAD/FMN-containing dehydrogenase
MSTVTTPLQAATRELDGFRGALIGPGDAGYDEARKVYNAMIDRRPALVAVPADAGEVAALVAFARRHELLLAVRGGGHNGAGLGTCEGGVVIDLSALKEIEVDPRARTVRVGGGCTWGEVDRATNEHGLATPSGIISTTGVGGLTLGGGLGHLTRRCGLAIDNLLEAELVLASGTACGRAPTSTPTCSGRSAGAAATSASSPRSSSGCTRWAPSWAGRRSGPWRTRPTS